MTRALGNFLRTLNTWTHRIFLAISEIALVAMVLIVTMTVTLRFGFNTGIVEIAALFLVAALTLLSIGFYVRDWVRHMNSSDGLET